MRGRVVPKYCMSVRSFIAYAPIVICSASSCDGANTVSSSRYGSKCPYKSFGAQIYLRMSKPIPLTYAQSSVASSPCTWLCVMPITSSFSSRQNAVEGARVVPVCHGARCRTVLYISSGDYIIYVIKIHTLQKLNKHQKIIRQKRLTDNLVICLELEQCSKIVTLQYIRV